MREVRLVHGAVVSSSKEREVRENVRYETEPKKIDLSPPGKETTTP